MVVTCGEWKWAIFQIAWSKPARSSVPDRNVACRYQDRANTRTASPAATARLTRSRRRTGGRRPDSPSGSGRAGSPGGVGGGPVTRRAGGNAAGIVGHVGTATPDLTAGRWA